MGKPQAAAKPAPDESPIAGKIGDGEAPQDQDPDQLPAIDPEHVPDEDDAGVAEVSEPAATPITSHDAKKVVRTALKALDKLTAILFRIDSTPAAELDDYAATITPAVAEFGDRPGPRFWLMVAALGFAGFIAGRVLEGVRARQSVTSAGTPDVVALGDGGAADSSPGRSGLGAEVVEPD